MSATKKNNSSARALFLAVERSAGAAKMRGLKNHNHDEKFDDAAAARVRSNVKKQTTRFRANLAAVFDVG